MLRRLGLVTLATCLASRPAAAAPTCTLTSGVAPCLTLTPPAPAPTAALAPTRVAESPADPWLDHGPAAPWLLPTPAPTPSAARRWGSLAGLGGIYAGLATWMYFAWYHDQPRLDGFEFGGDGYFGETTYAGGADKLGHLHANMAITRGGAELLRWGGWSSRDASLIGGALSWSLFVFVEVKDGYYYQFSPGDLMANTAGVALGMALTHWPALDRALDLRYSYWPSPEYLSILRGDFMGSERINSVNFAEDYSGQTYFLAVHLAEVPHPRALPGWADTALDYVDVGIGFQATRYKPDPPAEPPYQRTQRLFLGATLDLQRLLDRALRGRPSRAARWTRTISHGFLEVAAPPFTILPLVDASRSPDD